MSEGPQIHGVVVGHGGMAHGLVDAVRRIAGGAAEGLVALSNDGLSPADLQAALEERAGPRPTIVFTDLLSGSCALAAMMSARGSDRRSVVCGVNLPILLDFVFHRDLPMDELVARLVGKGREGIRAVPGKA